MTIRRAKLDDYKDIALMYRELLKAVYEPFNIKVNEDIFTDAVVIDWFKSGKDIFVCETDNYKIAGFTLSYIEDIAIVEPYYRADLVYIKPAYRKSRCAYMLYNNIINIGKQLELKIVSKALVGSKDKPDRILKKFGEPMFMEFISKEGL